MEEEHIEMEIIIYRYAMPEEEKAEEDDVDDGRHCMSLNGKSFMQRRKKWH